MSAPAKAQALQDPAMPRLASATLCAITRFIEAPSADLALLVARHLDCLAEHEATAPKLRTLSLVLAMRWRGWIRAQHSQASPAPLH